MKRIITLLLLFVPLCLNAQLLGDKHRLELGVDIVKPGEMFFEVAMEEPNTASVYASYRYLLNSSLSVGARYSFVIPHDAVLSMVVPQLHYINEEYTTVDETVVINTNTNYHTLNAIVEYSMFSYGPVSLFAGAGAGMQYRYIKFDRQLNGKFDGHYFSPDLLLYIGFELFDHLRITGTHVHDLHYPVSDLPSGAPFYTISLGWSF